MIKINQNFNMQKACDFCMIKINLNFLKYKKHVIFTIFKNITVLTLYV